MTSDAECVPSLRCQTSAPRSCEHSTKALSDVPDNGGARRDRTDDLLNANQALSQLSYGPLLGIDTRGSKAEGKADWPPRPMAREAQGTDVPAGV